MRPHVFTAKPPYCLALKPALIWVRCPKCGHPHQEYLGPPDLDSRGAEIHFLRSEWDRLAAMVIGRNSPPRRRGRARRR